jgi:molybdopterin/thiamine biosynthesis adenylyltransferase/rhodanese-related sulfurtransferase
MSMLSLTEIEQYSRHLNLQSFGLEKQLKLKAARVLLIGAGGLGCPIGLYLAAAGMGTIGVVDADRVERSNLQRQIAHSMESVGQLKAESLIERMRAINPYLNYQTYPMDLDSSNARSLITNYDLVIDGTDNFGTRYLLADACFLDKKPLLQGAVYEYQGQVSLFVPNETPCYRCLFRTPPERGALAPCSDVGVLGVVPGMIGLLMATEAIKWICELGTSIAGSVLLYDALTLQSRVMRLERDEECPLCGTMPAIQEPVSYFHRRCVDQPVEVDEEAALNVTFSEAEALVEQGVWLLDVRDFDEFSQFHLSDARHLPLSVMEEAAIQALLPDKAHPVLIYCQGGSRSLKAATILKNLGYQKVYNLTGGLSGRSS